jgi:ABC-2 type transport system ATP-binding protein
MDAIEARAVTKTYASGVQALAGVTFTIGWGQIFAYLGRNGSGKTTTVRVLTTLTRATTGSAKVAGHDVSSAPGSVRGAIGVAMQDAALDDLMTGMEHFKLIGQLWGQSATQARQRGSELLETFGLREAGNRLIATYSGGMRRRLDIATALFNRPRLLFLDEPTTGLDPQSRRAMWSMIRKLRDEGATVFLTTQYIEEAEELADTVAIIDGGRIVASGTPSQLKSSVGATTIRLRLRGSDLSAVRRAVGEGPTVTMNEDRWVHIELAGSAGSSPAVLALLARLSEQRLSIEGLSVHETSLEDVFVHLTGEQLDQSSGTDGASSIAALQRTSGLISRARRR